MVLHQHGTLRYEASNTICSLVLCTPIIMHICCNIHQPHCNILHVIHNAFIFA